MNTEKATARPWRRWNGTITAGTFEDEVKICEFNSTCRGGFDGEANAELIVKAVNNFDSLLAACKDSMRVINELYQQSPGDYARIMDVLNEAISQAERL